MENTFITGAKVVEGKQGNPVFLRKCQKAIVAVNLKYSEIFGHFLRFKVKRVIRELPSAILAEVEAIPTEDEPKTLAWVKLYCKKCDVKASLWLVENNKPPLKDVLHVYDVWVYKFSWCNRDGRAEAWLSGACPHMVPFAHSWLVSHGYQELAQALIRDYLGENVLQYFQGWKVAPVLSAWAAYGMGLSVNESFARAKASEAFDEAWKCWEELSKEFSELGRSTLQMLLEGVREKCVEIVEEVK